MKITDIITPGYVISRLEAKSKRQVLLELAQHVAKSTGLPKRRIFDLLTRRETLGTTAVGNGIAIPHGTLPDLDRVHGFFVRLDQPLDFDAIDDRPVDLIFSIWGGETYASRYLRALALVSRILRRKDTREKLRAARDAEELYTLIINAPL